MQPLSRAPVVERQLPSSLSALAVLAASLGVEISLDQIKRKFVLGTERLSSQRLVAMCVELGLEAQSLRLPFRELDKLVASLPALLFGPDGGAVILEGVSRDPNGTLVALVRDPSAAGDVRAAVDELGMSAFWTGEILLVKKKRSLTDEDQPFGTAWLIGQVLKERDIFRDIGIAALVSTVFALAPPFMVRIIIDRVLSNHSISTLNVLTGAILLIVLFETLLGYFRRILTQVATTRIDGRLNLYVLDRLLKLPMDYFERHSTGETISRLREVWRIRGFLTGQLFGTFIEAVPLIGVIPVMVMINWQLTILALVMSCMVAVIVYLFMEPLSVRVKRAIAAETEKSSHLVETLHGIKTIKSLSLEGRRRSDWDRLVANATEAQHDLGLMANYPETLTTPFERLIYSGCLLVGAYMILSSPDTVGTGSLMGFGMLAMRLSAPLVKMAHLQKDLTEARSSIAIVASVVNQKQEESNPNGLKLPIQGEVTFDSVRFRYSDKAPYALDEVSFKIQKGAFLGIMGRSGSGKSTITRLLQRLNSSYEGMIKIDGMDLREIDLHHLRSNIGVVPQENFLFTGSIRDNISMARPDAGFTDIVRAAQLAGAEEFIERLPRGYDTPLSEGAANLSGGQRQRLAIARALLINPAVLILDEATSALDAESEAIVNANLKRLAEGRTVISISHRLSMLVDADAILVMERGKVYDIGTHDELLQRCDIYKSMWYQQNRHLKSDEDDFALPASL